MEQNNNNTRRAAWQQLTENGHGNQFLKNNTKNKIYGIIINMNTLIDYFKESETTR